MGDGRIVLRCADALDFMRELEPGSVNLIATDPPYFRVKSEWWDRQWDNADGFIEWIGRLCREWRRVLAPNGSLYVFASPQMAARVECKVAEYFNVLNRIVWRKHDGTDNQGGPWSKADKSKLRSFFPQTEYIIFSEQYGADGYASGGVGWDAKCDELRGFVFEPLRDYLAGEWRRAELRFEQANEACGTKSMAGRHFFSRSQWCFPTAEHYDSLQSYANASGRRPAPPYEDYHDLPRSRFENGKNGNNPEYLKADYEYLRAKYEYLRVDYERLRAEYEHLRRPFAVTPNVPYTDVWDFATVQAFPGKHPSEKPEELMRHIISISTRPGDLVMDCFMGRGTTAVAVRALCRRFVGCDVMEKWYLAAKKRLARSFDEMAQVSQHSGSLAELPLFSQDEVTNDK